MCKDGSKLFGFGWSDYEGKAMVSNRHWIPRQVYDYSYYFNDDYYYNTVYDSYDSWYTERNAKRFSKKKNEKRHKSYIDKLLEGVV